jgi:hypothetical protein
MTAVLEPGVATRTRRFPFSSVPSSWYHLLWSDELVVCASREVRAFGRVLCAHRDANGRVRVSDERGHAWPISEVNAMIFVYADEKGRAPSFTIPEIPEISSGAFIAGGRIERVFRSHVQEIVENSIDLGHYGAVHGFAGRAELERFEVSGTRFDARIAAKKLVFGYPVPGKLELEYHGMGFGIGRMGLPVQVTNVVTCLPVCEETIRMRFTVFVKVKRVPVVSRALAEVLRLHLWHDVRGELSIFEQKRYLEQPFLVPGDGPIMKIRSWCKQFHAARS